MNYKAELRGFALDRVVRIAEVSGLKPTLAEVLKTADEIVDYLYIADKDIKSLLEAALPLIAQGNDLDKLDGLILELQQIRAEMSANIERSKQNDN